MKKLYRLSLVFCATDESKLLESAFQNTFIRLRKKFFECLFVLSDDCTENCLKTVKKLCCNASCHFIIQKNKGIGSALREAFENVNGTHILVWPADDGMDSSAVDTMIEISEKNPEKIVKISRWLRKGDFVNYKKIRKTINFFSQKFFSVLYRSSLTDYTNPTQIAPVSLYRKIKWERSGFDFIPEMIFKPLRIGTDFIEVPCKNIEKRIGSGHSDFRSLSKYYLTILNIRFISINKIIMKEQRDNRNIS